MIKILEIQPGLQVTYNKQPQIVECVNLFRDPDGRVMRKESVVYFKGQMEPRPLVHLADKGFTTKK